MNTNPQLESDIYDPQRVGITDLLKKDQVMEIVTAFRACGNATAGVFMQGESGICITDALYGDVAPEFPPDIQAIAELVLNTGEAQKVRTTDGGVIVGRPICLKYDGKSYLKGCFVAKPPVVPGNDPESCAVVLKAIGDMFSDRMSAAYLSRLAARDYEIVERRLKIAESPITSVIDGVATAFVLVDEQMILRWHNAALTKRTGIADMTGQICHKVVFGQDSVCSGCLVKQTFQTGQQQVGNISIQTEKWGVRHFLVTTAPVHDESGIVKFVLELAYDVTDAQRTESELARYKRLVDNSDDLMVVCDCDFEILACNRRLIDQCGYTEKELVGRPVLDLIIPEEHDELLFASGTLRETGMAMGIVRLARKDGSSISTQVFATYDRDTGVYEVVFKDISERLRLEQEIRARSDELEAQNTKVLAAVEERNRFFRNVSHELRTPLTSIIGFAELLLEDTEEPLSERQKTQLSRVVGNSHKLLGMVNDLLDLSRLDAGGMRMEWANIDLAEFLQQVVNNMMPLAKGKNVSVTVFAPKDLPLVMTDEQKLGQIVVNLLSNAIKFTPQGSVSLTVSKNEKSLLISVSDTGIGIPENEFDEIFKEFSRGSGAEPKNVGTGLGLAIARRLAAALGGEISVTSKAGEGSKFTLELPLTPGKVLV